MLKTNVSQTVHFYKLLTKIERKREEGRKEGSLSENKDPFRIIGRARESSSESSNPRMMCKLCHQTPLVETLLLWPLGSGFSAQLLMLGIGFYSQDMPQPPMMVRRLSLRNSTWDPFLCGVCFQVDILQLVVTCACALAVREAGETGPLLTWEHCVGLGLSEP